MSDSLKVGQRVEVTGKDVQGVVAFVGLTTFATGKWIGLKLDEPKGKNNGSVRGQVYFECEENYGMFVRASQVVPLDEHGKPMFVKEPSNLDESALAKARSRQSTPGTKPKPTTSRISLASSRQSLAGSRQSLSGSRQSLSGSRSHLASPVVEKSPENEGNGTQVSKRASFVETGFVETLKPQFTPGQSITTSNTPASTVEEKLHNLQFQQELDNRSQQIRDLTEKMETLKIKRQEDKEKMKDFDKLKIQLEQLLEFKAKIMESQSYLQRDLQKAKQEAKDAIEARNAHADEVADLAEAVEMATLDKEMAEEKAETLQLELDACKEKLEEVTLDLEIIKTEMQGKAGAVTTEGQGISTFEIKQLEQQNARLRETLVRLRDLSAHDKYEYQKLLKDMEQKNSEIAELGRTKEKLSARVEEMEQQLLDLQEQVDSALGAEDMVTQLTDQNLNLEEKVAKLEEEIAELEALQDMNDQLVESNAELEMDLREELDLAHASTREAVREKEAALETIADRDATINKFRELVQKLQEKSMELQQNLEKETNKPMQSNLPEILDFKKMFTESKANIKAIDLELRRLDVLQSQEHIKYLSAFMPDSFMNRGSDHDAILLLLLVPRLINKSEILLGQLKDKFPAVDKIDKLGILKGHQVEQFGFRCRLAFYIYSLQAILHQFLHSLNTAKTENLLKAGAAYPEMCAQEKILDGFIELVKRDQLDENVPTEAMEKCVGYFNVMFPMLLGPETSLNQSQLLNDNVRMFLNACDSINNDAVIIRTLIEGANIGDIGLLAQHAISSVEQLQQQLKLVKRRIPPDSNLVNLGLNKEIHENLYQCYQQAQKIMKTLQDIVKGAVQFLATSGDEKGLPQDKLKDIAINASDKIYEQDDLGPIQSIKNSLTFIVTQISQLAQFLQDNEFEITTANKNEDKPVPPIKIRADTVRKELEQTKTLTSKLENKESDIKELRKAIKEKQEQLSEMTIRKELAEKKLGNVNKDYELTIEKLQRKLEEAHNNFKKKEKEFEETLDHLQTDIDSLENEKGEMKEKLKIMSKKAIMEGMSKSSSSLQLSASMQSLGPNLPAVVKDSPMLLQEIENLRKLFNNERNERIKLQTEHMKKILDGLAPLPTFKTTKDDVLDDLYKEGNALKQEIYMTLATPKFPKISSAQPGHALNIWKKHFAVEDDHLKSLKMRAETFQNKVAQEIIKRKFGGQVQADFAVFPTMEMTKALNESKSVNIGYVKIPKQMVPANEKCKIINLELDFKNLQSLLQTLSC